MGKTGLFITRVQPGLHLGQIDGIMQAVEQGVDNILIGIGSANKEFTEDNPFTYEERKDMIELSIQDKLPNIETQVFAIPDMDSDDKWKNHILKKLPHFDYVISGNPWVVEIFQGIDKEIISLKIRENVKSSIIRGQIARGNLDLLKGQLTDSVIKYLQDINAVARLKDIFKNERITPNLVVDVVFTDNDGKLVLIERKNHPYGVALPGGFVDKWETTKAAAIREVKEETGADIEILDLLGVFDDPDRDSRDHNVSIAYSGKYIGGDFKAGDDAKDIIRVGFDEIEGLDFAIDDHKEMIKKFCDMTS